MFALTACTPQTLVSTFEECVEATGMVMESSPRQCRYEDQVYIEELPVPENLEEEYDDHADVFLASALQAFLGTENEITVKIEQDSSEHVRGVFQVEGDQAGAIFLAAWQQGEWEIVHAGNGVISCDVLAPYAFPADMTSDCESL